MKSGAKFKVSWTDEVDIDLFQEDKLLVTLVKRYGTTNWSKMAQELQESFGGIKKSGKQCRQRWFNHLDPNIVKKEWSLHEENILFQKHRQHGNKWIQIAESLPGRTDNSIKNHFYSTIRKSLRRINKFLGSKDGTIKIRRIKPSTLSQIFSQICTQSLDCKLINNGKKSKTSTQKLNSRQAAYHLINFSRWKLTDSKKKVHSSETQKLEKLLQDVDRINELNERQRAVIEKSKYEQANQISTPQKSSHNIMESELQQFQQSYEKLIELEPKANKRRRKRSAAITTQTETLMIKQQQVVGVVAAQDNSSLIKKQMAEEVFNIELAKEYSFSLELQEQNYPEIHNISGQFPWVTITPSFATPRSRQKRKIQINEWLASEQSQFAQVEMSNQQQQQQQKARERLMDSVVEEEKVDMNPFELAEFCS